MDLHPKINYVQFKDLKESKFFPPYLELGHFSTLDAIRRHFKENFDGEFDGNFHYAFN